MQNVNFLIDFIQQSKRQFVYATVTDDRIKDGLLNFVDKQTELCKVITKNLEDFSKISLDNIMSKGNVRKP
jgi:hypothetical protein